MQIGRRLLDLTIFFLVYFALAPAAYAEVRLGGIKTTPVAPASLKSGDEFSVAKTGSGKLSYTDGSYVKLKGDTKGHILPEGIFIEHGSTSMVFQPREKKFVVKSPGIVVGVLGTAFEFHVQDDVTRVVLTEGRLEVAAINGKEKVVLEAGSTLVAKAGKFEMRETQASDIDFSTVFPSTASDDRVISATGSMTSPVEEASPTPSVAETASSTPEPVDDTPNTPDEALDGGE